MSSGDRVRNILTICLKDLKDAVQNRNILVLVLAPIFFAVLLSFLTNASVGANPSANVAVYDQGNNAAFISYLNTTGYYNVFIVDSVTQLNDMVNSGTADVGITIPAGFSDDLKNGVKPTLEVLVNAGEVGAGGSSSGASFFTQTFKDVVYAYSGQSYPANIVYNTVGAKPTNVLTQDIIAPIVILISLLAIGVMMIPYTLTTEKEKRTLDAILVTPTSENDVVMGKMLFGFLATAIESILIFFGMVRIMSGGFAGVDFPAGIAFIILGSLVFVGVGLLIGSYANDLNRANQIAGFIVAPMLLLTIFGVISPALQLIDRFLPGMYVYNGLTDALKGSALSQELPGLAVLVVFNVLVYVLAIYLLRVRRNAA
jgi:ABC-2 type transport system permease protein